MKRLIVASLLLACACSALCAEPDVGVAPVPAWADEIAIEGFTEDRSDQFQFGVAYLLFDRQVKKTVDGFEYADRIAYEVVERAGLESAATIAHPFDPEQSTLAFNFIRVVRNGEVIDKLDESAITVLRQEQGLSASIVDGLRTAVIHLEDVRVGDIIDYAYSGTVRSALWPDHIFDSLIVDWSIPIAKLRYRLQVPKGVDVTTRSIATQVEPSVRTRRGLTTYEVLVEDPEPVPEVISTPGDWTTHGFLVFSTMSEWTDVAGWASSIFDVDTALPDEFVARLDALAMKHTTAEERATQVLRWVQEEIRYLGLEIGLGSHVPRAPSTTLANGYGDCKDKAVLLVAALDHLGIDAVPALASVTSGRMLPKLVPAIASFDHVVVGIDIGEETYWVDPTITHQGGSLQTLSPLGYGHVLPIRESQSTLVELPEPFPLEREFEAEVNYVLPTDGDFGLRLSTRYVYRGATANVMRLLISSQGQNQFATSFLDFYAGKYVGLEELETATFQDDLDANEITYAAEYGIARDVFDGSDLDERLPVFASSMQGIVPRQVEAGRVAPLALPVGTNMRHVIRVQTPGRKLSPPPEKSKSVAGIDYKRSFRSIDDIFEITFELAVRDRSSGLASLSSITALGDEIADDTQLTVNVGRAKPGLAMQLDMAGQMDPKTESALEEALVLIAQKDRVQALTILNTLLADFEDPTALRGYIQLLRGRLLVDLDRTAAAVEPMREGLSLFPKTEKKDHFTYIDLQFRHGDEETTALAMKETLARHPAAIDDFNIDWMRRFLYRLWQSDFREARDSLIVTMAATLDDTQSDRRDELMWVLAEAVTILSRQGKTDEASRLLVYVKHPEELALLMAKRDTASIWDAIADIGGPGLSTAVSEYVDSSRQAAEQAPNDLDKQMIYLESLQIAGRFEDALDHAAPYIEDWARIEAIGEDAFWLVNSVAYTMTYAGQPEEGVELLSRLIDIGIRENGALVSMAINRVRLLMYGGDYEGTLAAVEDLEALGEDAASEYGWMWVRASKACALHLLGRQEDALLVLNEAIKPNSDKNRDAYTNTLLCLDDLDVAADVVIERLQQEGEQAPIIFSFMETNGNGAFSPLLDEFREKAAIVRSMPEVRDEFHKVARPIRFDGVSSYFGAF